MTSAPATPNVWLARRSCLAEAVHEAVRAAHPGFTIKGSFARGDFHLSRHLGVTFSDVDLLLGDDGRDRHQWEADVASRIARQGWSIRVSVQHFDSTSGICAVDSRLLIVGEVIRFWDQMENPAFASYLTAKATLSMVQTWEPYTAFMGDPDYAEAIATAKRARVGSVEVFDAVQSNAILRQMCEEDESSYRLQWLLDTHKIEVARSWFLEALAASAVHPWLRGRLAELLGRGSQ